MRAYQSFLKDAGTPIGLVGSIGLGVWLVFQAISFLFSSPPNEKAWSAECEQLAIGNTVLVEENKMGGQHFCMTLVPVEEYPTLQSSETAWKTGCSELGGTYRSRNYTYTCYREEVVQELGPQETFGETP